VTTSDNKLNIQTAAPKNIVSRFSCLHSSFDLIQGKADSDVENHFLFRDNLYIRARV